jgi:pyruvate,water dikinase
VFGVYVHDLRDADACCGGKAVGLARLIRAGLPVPDGFVVDDRAFRQVVGAAGEPLDAIGHALAHAEQRIADAEIPDELARDVRERAATLGGLLAVRSSATIEDGARGAGAGVFASRVGVPVERVWDAIRAVWTSALAPLAAAYARERGETIAIGVIVQRFVDGERLTIYTRPPGHPERDEALVQRGSTLERRSRTPRDEEIERAIDARADGADVELVEPWIVQARPIVYTPPRTLDAPPPIVLAPLCDGRTWTWDVAHNPDPLSPAQQALVDLVERARIAPWSLRVAGGYLYTSPRDDVPAAPIEGDLAARAASIEAAIDRALGDAPPASLDDALDRYLAFYRSWAGELAPVIAAARARVPEDAVLGRASTHVERTLSAAARGELDEREVEARLGVLAPAWDVAVPTYGERPRVLHDAVARVRAAGARAETPTGSAEARLAVELADRDDLMFARAQDLVRRALLATSLGEDACWLALDDVRAELDPIVAARRAAAAREACARASRWQMPLVVGPNAREIARAPLRGVGTGPRVVGRVVRFASLATAISVGRGDVVVARAVTPALAVLVVGCAAIVSETGGLLDHGAALARELGVPCVVGCDGAWTELTDGALVTVDGDAGVVEP